jgi:hypothetical protein
MRIAWRAVEFAHCRSDLSLSLSLRLSLRVGTPEAELLVVLVDYVAVACEAGEPGR